MMNKTYRISENTEYVVSEDLTKKYPEKKYRTYTATTAADPKPVIIKEMDEKRAGIYSVLTGIQNRHIAKAQSVHKIDDSSRETLYIAITECVGHSDESGAAPTLSRYVKKHGPLDTNTALRFALQICDALICVHKENIIHRDLKPDNIMVSEETDDRLPCLKLIDFGVSDSAEDPYKNTFIKTSIEDAGTAGYTPHDRWITPRWDIYSLGCILNFMLTGHTPDMHIYSDSWEIRTIIEHCTDEYSARYADAKKLYKEVSHAARIGLWDRIPILRSIPGYRTHTFWKAAIATICYALLIYLGIDIIRHRGLDAQFFIFTLCWFFLPVMIAFDPFYLRYRIKPLRAIRHNTRLFIILQAIGLIFSLFILPNILLALLIN